MVRFFAQVDVLRPFLRGQSTRRLGWFVATLIATAAAVLALLFFAGTFRRLIEPFGVPVAAGGPLAAVERVLGSIVPSATNSSADAVLVGGGLVAVALVCWFVARFVECRIQGQIVADTEAKIRRAVYRQAYRLSPPLEPNLTGTDSSSCEVVIGHLPRIRRGLGAWLELSQREPVPLVALAALALWTAPLLTAAAFVIGMLAVVLAASGLRQLRASLAHREQRALREEKLLTETIGYVQMAKAILMDEVVRRRFDQLLRDLVRIRRQDLALACLSWPVLLCVATFAVASFGVLLLYQLALRSVSLDSAALMVGAIVLATLPIQNVWGAVQTLRNSEGPLETLAEFLQQEPDVLQLPDARFLDPLSKELRLRHIFVARSGRPLLQDLNVAVEAGSVVAVLSPDRATYRAIAFLLTRLIDPDEGQILIDGTDIRKATLESLRANVGIALDGYYVFTASVRANIAGSEQQRPLAEVVDAAKRAHAHNFIQRLAQGYDTVVGPLGEQLTIGEQFLIALARLIVQNPALAVIEEPWQPMDDQTRQLVDDTLRWFCRERTVLFLARRISTLKQADAVILIENGAVKAIGPHEELTRSSELYRHLQYLLGQRQRAVVSVVPGRART